MNFAPRGIKVDSDRLSSSVAFDLPKSIEREVRVSTLKMVSQSQYSAYEAGSWLPFGNWESCSFTSLCSADATVSVIAAETTIAKTLATNVKFCRNQEEVDLILSNAPTLVNNWVDSISNSVTGFSDLQVLGVSAGPIGRKTATVDPRISKHIGLHIDDWDRLKDNDRGNARLRLCLNLGQQTRHLLIVPIAIHVAQLWKDQFLCEKMQGTDFARYLMATLRPRVYSIPVPPLHAYIASTETLIHDASTALMSKTDICITVLGHFNLCNLRYLFRN